MKRILTRSTSWILALAIAVSMMTPWTALAAEGNIVFDLSSSSTNVRQGEEFTVDVAVSGSAFCMGTLYLQYDPARFQFDSGTVSPSFSTVNLWSDMPGLVMFSFSDANDYSVTSTAQPCAELTFHALSDASLGEVSFTATHHQDFFSKEEADNRDFSNPFDIVVNDNTNINVLPALKPATDIAVTPQTSQLNVGQTLQLNAALTPADSDDSITWESLNSEVAAVDANGLVTAIAPGDATIRATADSGVSDTAVVHVNLPLTGITLNVTSMELTKGETGQLQVSYQPENTTDDKTVTWSSSDPTIASVTSGGENNATATVTALNQGTTNITATVGAFSQSCSVTVNEIPLESIALDKDELILEVGESDTLSVIYNPADTTDDKTVVWSTGNGQVATVDSGLVTAVGPGNTTITATVNGKTASATVEVVEPIVIGDVSISNNSAVTDASNDNKTPLMQNEKLTFEAVVTDLDGEILPDETVAWSVSGAQSANTIIDENGVLLIARDELAPTLTVTATSVTDPSVSVCEVYKLYPFGDFSMDGKRMPQDLDLFLSALASMTSDPFYDLTRDGQVDSRDKMAFLYAGYSINSIAISNNSEVVDQSNSGKTPLMQNEKITFQGVVLDPNGEVLSDEAVTWSVSGNQSADTTIDENGVLLVARDELAPTLTIIATSASSPDVSVSETYKVYQFCDFTMDGKVNIADKNALLRNTLKEPFYDLNRDGKVNIADTSIFLKSTCYIDYIAISNNSAITDEGNNGKTPLMQNEKITFAGTVSDSKGNVMPNETVTWSVSGNQSAETTIDENGVLLVASDESASTLTVIATSVSDPDVSVSVTYKVYPFGDFSMDGVVNSNDMLLLARNMPSNEVFYDLNRDGVVDDKDKELWTRI